MASRNKKGLEPNKNREAGTPVPPLENILAQSGHKEQVSKVWTGQKINFGGKFLPQRPQKSRIAKEALYNTGPKRFFDRHAGTGRPLNEAPKKNGGGGHNWGSLGTEIDVELASKEELREFDRQFNPTAPGPGEEPVQETFEGDEEWAGDEGEFYGSEFEGFGGWEWMIAGEERAAVWPGYWEGLEGVRVLWGDELKAEDFTSSEELPHASWHAEFSGGDVIDSTQRLAGADEERRVALQVGGMPKWVAVGRGTVPWGDKEAERAAFEGAPPALWGREPERRNPETRGISDTGVAPASRAQITGLPEEGPLGLEADLMSRGKKEEAPATFINKDIREEVRLDGRITSTIGEGKSGQAAREALQKMKDADKGQARFDLGENISLPSS